MNKWDFVLVKFPFTDGSTEKVRPSLVLCPVGGKGGGDLILAAVSSQPSAAVSFAVSIETTHPEFKTTGLITASVIQLAKIFTLDRKLVIRNLGTAGPLIKGGVETQLRSVFQLV